jgi:hypothetical protein
MNFAATRVRVISSFTAASMRDHISGFQIFRLVFSPKGTEADAVSGTDAIG